MRTGSDQFRSRVPLPHPADRVTVRRCTAPFVVIGRAPGMSRMMKHHGCQGLTLVAWTLRPPLGCMIRRARAPCGWRSLGRLYGISMGEGWVRLDTDFRCPVHGGQDLRRAARRRQ